MVEKTGLAQDLIRQLGVNESNFDFDPFRETLNLKSDQVNVADYGLPVHPEVFSLLHPHPRT